MRRIVFDDTRSSRPISASIIVSGNGPSAATGGFAVD
jgi:hypothetical protein